MTYLGQYSVFFQIILMQTHTLEFTCVISVLTNTALCSRFPTFLFSLAFTRCSASESQIDSIWWPAQRFMYSQRKVRKSKNPFTILWCELWFYMSRLMQTLYSEFISQNIWLESNICNMYVTLRDEKWKCHSKPIFLFCGTQRC